ncbi:MAG: sensor histidine kinase [Novosphingobium sp.]|nr:sensor histidine kinase [Novosphingobium sp.]
MNNVLAHCPPGTRTTLSVRRAGNAAVLGVADNGPGVPQTDLANLFKPFQRGNSGTAKGGVGLSLALVNAIAHHRVARIGAVTDGGLSVAVTFPLAAAMQQPD